MPSHPFVESLTTHFEELTDPRMDRTKRHVLLDVVVLALAATIGGANGWADIERFANDKIDLFRQLLSLPNGIPSHDTFGRIFARLDPGRLVQCIQHWLSSLQFTVGGQIVAEAQVGAIITSV